MSRSVWILSGLLGIALCASYLSWSHKAPRGAKSRPVTVLDVEVEDIVRIEYRSGDQRVAVVTQEDDRGRWYAVTTTKTLEPPPPEPPAPEPVKSEDGGSEDGGSADAASADAGSTDADGADGGVSDTDGGATLSGSEEPPSTPAPTEESKTFTGGKSAERVVKQMAPLNAYRVMTDVSAERLEALGLAPPEGELEITRKGGRVTKFGVGGKAFGASRRYLHAVDTSTVYLVEAMPFRSLEAPDRQMIERNVVGVARADVASVELTAGSASRTVQQFNRDDRRAAYWAGADSPDQKDEQFSNWLDKVFRLRVEDYVEDTEMGVAEAVAQVKFHTDDGTYLVALYRSTEGEKPVFYARSDYLRRYVKLREAAAGDVVADLEAIIGE